MRVNPPLRASRKRVNLSAVANVTNVAGRWSVIVLGLSIPISVALDNILLGLIGLFWLAGGQWRSKVAVARANPVAMAALMLFGVLACGLLYGNGRPGDVTKYIDLLFVPMLIWFFGDERTRVLGLRMFCIAVIASIAVSHLASLGALVDNPWLRRTPRFVTGFKYTITHGLIVGYAAYVFALFARDETTRKLRYVWIALAVIAVHNVVFMTIGRTGHLILVALFTYFFAVSYGRRGLLAMAVLAAVTFTAAYTTSQTFEQRFDAAAEQLRDWRQGQASATSIGLRLEYYTNSLLLVRENPVIGVGTGGFSRAYASVALPQNMEPTDNPHNEYLMIAVQTGLVGLAFLLHLFWRHFRSAGLLQDRFYRHLGRGLLLTFAIGCLFNSLLLDHTEGLLFAWLTALIFSSPKKISEAA